MSEDRLVKIARDGKPQGSDNQEGLQKGGEIVERQYFKRIKSSKA